MQRVLKRLMTIAFTLGLMGAGLLFVVDRQAPVPGGGVVPGRVLHWEVSAARAMTGEDEWGASPMASHGDEISWGVQANVPHSTHKYSHPSPAEDSSPRLPKETR